MKIKLQLHASIIILSILLMNVCAFGATAMNFMDAQYEKKNST